MVSGNAPDTGRMLTATQEVFSRFALVEKVLLSLPTSSVRSARSAFRATNLTILRSPALNVALLWPLRVRFNPVLCAYGTRAIPAHRESALDARWDIPGVREDTHWTAPRVKVISAQNLTVVEVSLRWHRGMAEMGLDAGDPRLGEYLVFPPTKNMLLKVDLCVWDEEAGDIAHVFAQVEVMACPVGPLVEIAEAMMDLAVALWPTGRVGGDFIRADHVGRAVDMLTCFGGLGEAASLVWGGLKVVMEAKVAIEPYEEEEG